MSSFALKWIALVLMTIDHVGYYFEGMPAILRIVGRASYPLFLFCMVWGYHYTRSRKLFLIRLYLMSLFMTGFGLVVNMLLPTNEGYGNHNIFVPMLLVGVIISTIEAFAQDKRKGYLWLAGIAAAQILYLQLPSMIPALRNMSGDVLTGIVPSLAVHEYGFEFVALGVLLYFLRDNKPMLTVSYLIFCIYQFGTDIMSVGAPDQFFMIMALPLLLCYNNRKGRGSKYFFYIFYPAHTLLLYYLANFVIV